MNRRRHTLRRHTLRRHTLRRHAPQGHAPRRRTRRAGAVGICAIVCAALAGGPAAAQTDTGWVIEEFTITLDVAGDGTVSVTEDIVVDFAQLQRRGIFRAIPARYRLGEEDRALVADGVDPAHVRRALDIGNISVSSTAPADIDVTRPNRFGEADLRIRIGDPDVTVTGRQRYRISYDVRGAMNGAGDGAELSWNATGDQWPVPIHEAVTVVNAPAVARAACFHGPDGSTAPCAQRPGSDGRVEFAASGLEPGSGMTVVVGFPPGSVAVDPPLLVEEWTPERAFVGSPAALPLAVLVALLSFGGVGLLAYRKGRDRVTRGGVRADGQPDPGGPAGPAGAEPAGPAGGGQSHPGGPAGGPAGQRRGLFSPWPVTVQYRPPDDLRPAQLGVIIDERVEPVDVSATIVDLAVRGFLTIEETSSGRIFTRKDWTLVRTDTPADGLMPFEATLLEGLFSGGERVELSALKGKFSSDYEQVSQELYRDAVSRRWFRRSPKTTRTLWQALGIVALIAAVGVLVLAALFTTAALAAVPLVPGAIALLLAHRWMPRRTPEGSRMLVRTLGFREYITTAEAGRMEFAEQENLFEAYLPYAVLFGAVDRWASAFAGLGAAAAAGGVGWYASHHGRGDLSSLSEGLSGFSHTVGSSLPTAPPSSSGGSSGGGSSGGGFGGGGGGSW